MSVKYTVNRRTLTLEPYYNQAVSTSHIRKAYIDAGFVDTLEVFRG